VTTNYDDVLERAFARANVPFSVVYYAAEREKRGRFVELQPDGTPVPIRRQGTGRGQALDDETVILKIHGAFNREYEPGDSYVITEDHYIEYLARMDLDNLIPVKVLERLRNCHFLFMGYSLADWNLRAILYRLWSERRRDRDWWAIQVEPSDLERRSWRRRGVDIFDIDLGDYIDELDKRFLEAVGPGP